MPVGGKGVAVGVVDAMNFCLATSCGGNEGLYLVGSFLAWEDREGVRVGRRGMRFDDLGGLDCFDFGLAVSCIWGLSDIVLILVLLRD